VHSPSRPSTVVKDLDPIVEKVILRCLETEPTARPATALAVAAALPGGDPLAAALAAGETPSPQLVAASGETTGLRPRAAVACLLLVLVGLAVGASMMIRYSGLEKMHLEQTPEVLTQKAHEIISRIGYPEKPADSGAGFNYDTDFRDYAEHDKGTAKSPAFWDTVMAGRPSILYFWYRQSPKLMSASDYQDFLLVPGILEPGDPPTTVSGMVNVQLDPQGRLIYLQVIPPQKEDVPPPATAPPTDWSPLFAAAGLDVSQLQPAQPQWNSLAAADTRAAWTGVWPGSTWPLRVEAASWHGKPVHFALIGPWNKPWRMVSPETAAEKKSRISQIIGLSLLISLLIGSALLARRNYRHGRGDREGAFRLAVIMFTLEILMWLCRSHFVAGFETFGLLMLCIASGLLWGGTMWMLYLAVEPWIRRRWPQALVSWTRLLAGQLRDPLVGRDILFGVAFGTIWLVIFQLENIPLARIGAPPGLASQAYLVGGRHALGQWLSQIPNSISGTLQFFFLLLGLKVVLRKDWIAATVFVGFFVGLRALQSSHLAVDLPAIFLIYAILVLIVFRFGLVPLAAAVFTVDMLANVPMTMDTSAWYMGTASLALLSVVALAGWGFYHSLGGEPVWKGEPV
jgi:hypothetical protein